MSTRLHPSELAYAFSYAGVSEIIGWGSAPFLPTSDAEAPTWLTTGEARMLEAGRLTGDITSGLNFAEDFTDTVLALVDPTIALVAERREGDGVRRLSVHASKETFAGLTRETDGSFSLTRYTDISAAAVACAGFLGTTLATVERNVRLETTGPAMAKLQQFAKAQRMDTVIAALAKLGIGEGDATSAAQALAAPEATGLLSVFYCAGNSVQDVEAFSVMTNEHGHSWLVFFPASADGPMVLERSSIASLASRVTVGIAARFAGHR